MVALHGRQALAAEVGTAKFHADWTRPDHCLRRLVAEFLGDISAHFNPAMTVAFALRGDMGWPMAGVHVVVQLIAATAGSLLARAFFGPEGRLAATTPQPGMSARAMVFEAVITFGLALLVLAIADGPKLNGQFVPLAVGAYIMACTTIVLWDPSTLRCLDPILDRLVDNARQRLRACSVSRDIFRYWRSRLWG